MSTFDERKQAHRLASWHKHMETNDDWTWNDGHSAGADFGREYERERVKGLIEAVKEYRRECEAVVPDYTMKRITRERLFAALEASEGEEE